MIVAFCRGCGGWTMWHGDARGARAPLDWIDRCRTQGDRIERLEDGADIGEACPSSAEAKRCEVEP